MKKALLILTFITLLAGVQAFAENDENLKNGEKIFRSFVCHGCHDLSTDTLGPPLKKIASAGKGESVSTLDGIKLNSQFVAIAKAKQGETVGLAIL